MNFGGKVALITGASNGIGADTAVRLAKLGAKVSIVGRNEKRLNEVAEQIKKTGAPAPLAIVGDVTKDAERIVGETIEEFQQLNELVNNAGTGLFDGILTAKPTEFDRVFDINLRSVINLMQLCIPHPEKTHGNIVNVSSVAGLKPLRSYTTYGMSKAALDHLTKCAALDLAPKRIRVNSVSPSVIRTKIYESVGLSAGDYEKILDKVSAKYPVGRPGEAADIAEAIAFLADDERAAFVTGTLLLADGGKMLL